MLAQSIILSSVAAIASAASLSIQVSDANSGLTFSPNVTTAKAGDVVTFHFFPKNHAVAQSSFSAPCAPLADGFFSGYVPTAAGEANKTYSITVKDDQPIWFYCPQSKHCNLGMAGVINPPANATLEQYVKAASSATVAQPTVSIGSGGSFGAAAPSSSGASSAGSASSTSAGSAKPTTTGSASSTASSTASGSAVPKSGAEMKFQVSGALALAAAGVAALL